jgi:uncharacterized membrane protein
LLRERKWAFPSGIVLIGLFILYEIYRFAHTHSLILVGVIIIDLAILWIIWREYQNRFVKNTARLA